MRNRACVPSTVTPCPLVAAEAKYHHSISSLQSLCLTQVDPPLVLIPLTLFGPLALLHHSPYPSHPAQESCNRAALEADRDVQRVTWTRDAQRRAGQEKTFQDGVQFFEVDELVSRAAIYALYEGLVVRVGNCLVLQGEEMAQREALELEARATLAHMYHAGQRACHEQRRRARSATLGRRHSTAISCRPVPMDRSQAMSWDEARAIFLQPSPESSPLGSWEARVRRQSALQWEDPQVPRQRALWAPYNSEVEWRSSMQQKIGVEVRELEVDEMVSRAAIGALYEGVVVHAGHRRMLQCEEMAKRQDLQLQWQRETARRYEVAQQVLREHAYDEAEKELELSQVVERYALLSLEDQQVYIMHERFRSKWFYLAERVHRQALERECRAQRALVFSDLRGGACGGRPGPGPRGDAARHLEEAHYLFDAFAGPPGPGPASPMLPGRPAAGYEWHLGLVAGAAAAYGAVP